MLSRAGVWVHNEAIVEYIDRVAAIYAQPKGVVTH
jgi:hypothetical protein